MFYVFSDKLKEISLPEINGDTLSAGYVSGEELRAAAERFGFSSANIESCGEANKYFRSGVEIYDDYTFTELRIMNGEEQNDDDCVALFIKKNLFIVVDVEDRDGSTKSKFTAAMNRYSPESATLEKLIYAFLDSLVSGDIKSLEDTSLRLSELEDELQKGSVDKNYNVTLLEIKKLLLRAHSYYEQILDITEAIDENENDLFSTDTLLYINNIGKRVERLKEDADSLKNTVEHLQDAYNAYMDGKLNNTMKIFTVLTSIFFPLTIIVGWYGMNFQSMPEFTWKYGYVYVILLSVVTVAVLTLTGKKKKWF